MRWSALALFVVTTACAQPRVDRHGDPLPEGAVNRLGTVRFRLGGGIYAFAVSPDGRRVLTADHDRSVTIFDSATGRRLQTTGKAPDSNSSTFAFSPDCSMLAVGDYNGIIHLLDVAKNKEVRTIKAGQNSLSSLTFSPDGSLVAGGGHDGIIRAWAVGSGDVSHEFPKVNNAPRSLTFRPDGKMLAVVSDDNTVHVWTIPPSGEARQFKNVPQVKTIAFSRDGSLLAIAAEKNIVLRDPNTGAARGELKGHDKPVDAIAFLPDSKSLISASDDGTLRVWDLKGAKEVKRIGGLRNVNSMVLTRDGRFAYVSAGHAIRAFDIAAGKELLASEGHESDVYSIAFTPDGATVVTGGTDCRTLVWDVASTRERQRESEHTEYVFAVAVSPDGKTLATVGGKPFLRLRPLAGGPATPEIKGLNVYCFCVAFSSDGSLVATGDREKVIHVFDTKTAKQVTRFRNRELEVYAIAFSPDGFTLASAGNAKTVFLWNIAANAAPRPLEEQQDAIRGLAFSPDGRTLAATGDNNTIRLFDVAAGQVRLTLKGHTKDVNRLAFSPDGRTLASAANDHTVRLWDVATGLERRKFEGHIGPAYCVAFSPDGRRLASGSADTTVLFWDVSGKEGPKPPAGRLGAEDRNKHWVQLAESDAAAAFKAIVALAADADGSVAFFAERLKPAAKLDPTRVSKLLADLDATKYPVREKAMRELAKLGDEALPALMKYLESEPPPEARRRAEQLISRLVTVPPPEVLRVLRAIEALELMATPDARRLLQLLATGEPAARITRDAKLSLQRLEKK